jgi:hypothetical protein
MTPAELRLIEEGWEALVDRLGWTEAVRFMMLLDRRTGGAMQHLQHLWATPGARRSRRAKRLASHQFDDVFYS